MPQKRTVSVWATGCGAYSWRRRVLVVRYQRRRAPSTVVDDDMPQETTRRRPTTAGRRLSMVGARPFVTRRHCQSRI